VLVDKHGIAFSAQLQITRVNAVQTCEVSEAFPLLVPSFSTIYTRIVLATPSNSGTQYPLPFSFLAHPVMPSLRQHSVIGRAQAWNDLDLTSVCASY
jgi:hypothetical protein